MASRTTEAILANGDELFRCRTARRMAEEKANDAKVLEIIKVGYLEYVLTGAKTHGPRI